MPNDVSVGEKMKRPGRAASSYTLLLATGVVLICNGFFLDVAHSKLEQVELQVDSLTLKIQQQQDALRTLQQAADELVIKEATLRLDTVSRGRLSVTSNVDANAVVSALLDAGMTVSNVVINSPANADGKTADRASGIIEFDVVAPSNMITFNFVFGSKQNPKIVNRNSNDAFGLFISGPGPVCNAGYYNNTNIATMSDNVTPIPYNAFDTTFTRRIAVCPCQTYHLKLVIAEPRDCNGESCDFIDIVRSDTALTATPIPSPSMAGGCTGSVRVIIKEDGPFTYNWSPAPGAGQGTNTPSEMCPGTYTVTIYDANSCAPPATFTVTIPTTNR